MTIFLAASAAVILAGIIYALADVERSDERDDGPAPCSHDDPRCVALAEKLAEARAAMTARGTPFLLGNRPAWKRASGVTVITLPRRA